MITIKFRRDHSLDWTRVNPILASGEPGYETDTRRFKIGDGHSRWIELDYFSTGNATIIPGSEEYIQAQIQAHIDALVPHPSYDDGPSLSLLYENAKV